MARFLTPANKVAILSNWEKIKADFARRMAAGEIVGDPAGRGFPDPDIYEFCDQINEINGICTIQSCSGHRIVENGEVVKHQGQIWIRLNRRMRDLYLEHSPALCRSLHINFVALILGDDAFGGETADILFKGLEEGETRDEGLANLFFSQHVIVEFFRGLALEAADDMSYEEWDALHKGRFDFCEPSPDRAYGEVSPRYYPRNVCNDDPGLPYP